MLFPVFPCMSAFGETCSFSHSRDDFSLPIRSRRVSFGQVGNSMNVSVAGAAILFCLFHDPAKSSKEQLLSTKSCLLALGENAMRKKLLKRDSNASSAPLSPERKVQKRD